MMLTMGTRALRALLLLPVGFDGVFFLQSVATAVAGTGAEAAIATSFAAARPGPHWRPRWPAMR